MNKKIKMYNLCKNSQNIIRMNHMFFFIVVVKELDPVILSLSLSFSIYVRMHLHYNIYIARRAVEDENKLYILFNIFYRDIYYIYVNIYVYEEFFVCLVLFSTVVYYNYN